jgi:NAD(P)-dependent dehydrogenase (short-subunit alcohol dehydrogenase family)
LSGERVALVTGGVRGLGLAVVRRLGADGWKVHATWRSSAELAAALGRELGAGRVHRCDLTDPAGTRELLEGLRRQEGRLDALVHAVGDYHSGALADLDPLELRRLFESNVDTAFHAAAAARADLRASRGALVFFGCAGLEGLRARRRCAAYTAAKSALVVLARSLAVEEAPHGVRVNVVSPGHVPHEHAHPDSTDPSLAARIPAGRVGAPPEVAAAVAWLLSDQAAYVTGADLPVAGGYML